MEKFFILCACGDGLSTGKLVYYMYLSQVAGYCNGLRFGIKSGGIDCRKVNTLVASLVTEGYLIKSDTGSLSLTEKAVDWYDSQVITWADADKLAVLKYYADMLTEKQLYAVCITDIVINDFISKGGKLSLKGNKDYILHILNGLIGGFSEDEFNTMLKIIRLIKEA